jgi:S-adenosylmethionine:tRNA ribosyltransferase-isomerase
MTELTRKDFSFDLPEHLIAHEALAERDAARMLVRTNDGMLTDRLVRELPDILPPDSLLLLNNTKVFPSRLVGNLESGGKVEIFLLEKSDPAGSSSDWLALGKPFRKFKPGKRLIFGNGLTAVITGTSADEQTPSLSLAFSMDGTDFQNWLDQNGIIPLPPYIRRENPLTAAESADTERYQTVYAKDLGSVAAPTAGLHLTPALLSRLSQAGIEVRDVCLHVGAGTFLPVKTDDISAHKMHRERFSVPTATLQALQAAKKAARPVFAVGTTTFRSLESLFRAYPDLLERDPESVGNLWHTTDLFIFPKSRTDRYRSPVFDGILTNFHQPESTLLMLVSALIGFEEMQRVYGRAVAANYRFYSYGDCCLFWF